MTQEELNRKIEELEKQIAELKQVKVEKWWKPKNGEHYWCFDLLCEKIDECEYENANCENFFISTGNCFKTKEEAEEFGKKLTTQLKYKKYVKEHSEPLDWNNGYQVKYYLYFSQQERNWKINIDYDEKSSTVYASSEQVIKDAIDYIGQENVKYLFED